MNRVGKEGEELALKFLKDKGFRVLERNYRTPIGEIDIIARDGNTLVFIEVKTRSDMSFGSPFESVTQRKRDKIHKTALWYIKGLGREPAARFDVLSIDLQDGRTVIEHIKDAFEI